MKVRRGSRGSPRAARCCTEDSTHSTAARASGLDSPCRSTACSPSFRPRHSATCAITHDGYASVPVVNMTDAVSSSVPVQPCRLQHRQRPSMMLSLRCAHAAGYVQSLLDFCQKHLDTTQMVSGCASHGGATTDV